MPMTKQPISEPVAGHTFSLATILLLTTVVAIFMAARGAFFQAMQAAQASQAAGSVMVVQRNAIQAIQWDDIAWRRRQAP